MTPVRPSSLLLVLAACATSTAPEIVPDTSIAPTPQARALDAVVAAQHQLQRHGDTLRLVNPATDLHVVVGGSGARLAQRHGDDPVGVTLRTARVGRGDTLAVVAPARPTEGGCDPADTRRDPEGACLRRAETRSGPVTTWWDNPQGAPRQGWTIAEQDGSGPLRIEVAVDGLPARVDGTTVVLGGGTRELRGEHLAAWDADGDDLGVRAEATADGFALLVDVDGADWPVTVDPSWRPGEATFQPDTTNSGFGAALTLGDLDGDGHDDLVVGASLFDAAGTDFGRVFVFYGPDLTDSATIDGGTGTTPRFGAALAVGDYNADGLGDLAVGAPAADGGQTDEGAVYVYDGRADRTYGTAERSYETNVASDDFGTSIAWGDINGDSPYDDDLVIGCPRCDVTGINNEGRVYIVAPTAGSLPLSGAAGTQSLTVLDGSETGSRHGQRVLVADLDGDGYDDVVTGAPLANGAGLTDSGIVRVWPGSSTGPASGTSTVVATGTQATGYLGSALAVGDQDGDGDLDLVIGARATGSGGEVWLMPGASAALPSTVARKWSLSQAGANFGVSVAMADLDGDGKHDVIAAGDLYDATGTNNEGRVVVYMGRTSSLAAADGTFDGDVTSQGIGFALAAGAVDSAGDPKVFVSAPLASNGHTAEGFVVQLDLEVQLDADGDDAWVHLDCNDAEPAVSSLIAAFVDADADGFGGSPTMVCPLAGGLAPLGYSLVGGDCNDGNDGIHPGAAEAVGLGVDNDCSGTVTCYANADNDGARVATPVASVDTDCADPGEALASLPPGDCDDNHPGRFPGNPEIVGDGIDQDCIDGDTCYADQDADGWRTSATVVSPDLGCTDPGEAPASAPDGDCDDSLAMVHPGAAEIPSNLRDDDCDNVELCWSDMDGDGHSAGGTITSIDLDCVDGVETPNQPPPFDCNDASPAIFPGAADFPGDGIDQDCSGADAVYGPGGDPCDAGGGMLTGVVSVEDDDLTVSTGVSGAAVGSATAIGDFDGDGIDDLVVGVPGDDSNGTDAGAVALFWGPVTTGDIDVTTADVLIRGEIARHRSGAAVASAGDIDGDGADDLLIGGNTSGATTALGGIAHLVLSGRLMTDPSITLATEHDARFLGNVSGDALGQHVAGAGDLDGDGFGDLVLGAPNAAGGGIKRGAAYVFFGPVTGSKNASQADATFHGAVDGSRLGWAASGVGDFDGDGYGDLAVGAPFDPTAGTEAGSAFIFQGGPTLSGTTVATAAHLSLYGRPRHRAGAVIVRAGDLVGSNAPDVWISATSYGSKFGAVYLIAGQTPGGTSPLEAVFAHRLAGSVSDDLAGSSLAGEVDVDGDGQLDVVVGGPRATGGATQSGAVWVAYGPFTYGGYDSLRTRAGDAMIKGVAYKDLAGQSVAAGDLDGDGYADVAIGTPGAAFTVPASGYVAVHRGGNDPADLMVFWFDSDSDGYGDPTSAQLTCAAPPGYVENGNDCDDQSALFNPSAFEPCGTVDHNCDGVTGAVDQDGDGVIACEGDCNDLDDTIHPGADDLCGDNIDNDCNGEIDGATATDTVAFYADADGDGWGWRSAPIHACTAPFEGLILVGGDCDDLENAVNPDAAEVCDGVDNDCDDDIDEDSALDAITWYRDGDDDGAGDPYQTLTSCLPPSTYEGATLVDYVAAPSDCDDTRADVGPGATEVCDGVDNDCDGTFYLGGLLTRNDVDFATFSGGRVGDRLGAGAVAVIGDQDFDGDGELVFGYPDANDGAETGGMVLLVRGSPDGGAWTLDPSAADGAWNVRILGTRKAGRLGTAVASGDLNGDGVADLAVAAPGARVPNTNQGAVYVFFGPIPDGLRTIDSANVTIRGTQAYGAAGASLAIGDHDGDGYADLLIGETGWNGGQGAGYLVYGQPVWSGQIDLVDQIRLTGGDANDAAGWGVALADVTGDGRAEAFVGAPFALDLNRGQLLGWWGAAVRLTGAPAANLTVSGHSTGDAFANTVANAGDVDGDTFGDLLVGSSNNGAAMLLGGPTPWASGPLSTVAAVRFQGRLTSGAGRALASPGDVDGDGYDDVAIGASDDDTVGRNFGAVYLVYGRPDFDDVVAPGAPFDLNTLESFGREGPGGVTLSASNAGVFEGARIHGIQENDIFGHVVGGGDFTGDGFGDLVVGMPETAPGGLTRAGTALGFVGGAYGVDLNAADAQTWWWDRDLDTWTDDVSFASCDMHVPQTPTGTQLAVLERTLADDCVDTDPAIHPCAVELDGDAIDSNCDGSLDRVPDGDGDGLAYADELAYGTCPELADSDGDGETDDEELYRGSDPNDPADYILGPDDLVAGSLRITELMIDPAACVDTSGEYVEITNTLPARVEIGGVEFYDAGGSSTLTGGPFVLASGERIVVAQSVGGYATCYPGLGAYTQSGLGLGNTGDAFGVRYGATVVDAVDYTAWTVVSGFAYELDDDLTTWCLSDTPTPSGDQGSPGLANGACGASGLPGIASLLPGDLQVTELMVDPDACADDGGEYVEVLYSGSQIVDLTGLTFTDAGGATATLGPVIASPGDRLVFARLATQYTACYGTAPDAQFGFGLDNTGDLVRLSDGGSTVFDEVDFLTWSVTPGVAFERDDGNAALWCLATDTMPVGDVGTPTVANGACAPDDFDGDGVTDGAEACLGIDPFTYDSDGDGAGDGVEIALGDDPHGPGVDSGLDEDGDGLSDADEVLAGTDPWSADSDGDGLPDADEATFGAGICVPDTDDDGVEDGTETDLGFDPTDDTDHPVRAIDLLPGDLVITEYLADPSGLCTEASGEYVELHYRGIEAAVLDGVVISDAGGSSHTVSGSLITLPGERVVFARSVDFGTCYGFAPDRVSGLVLDNLGDTITVAVGATVLDQHTYASSVVVAGRSRERDDVDDLTWCLGDVLTAGGQQGTPGDANGVCPAAVPGVDTLGAGALVVTEVMVNPNACGGDDTQYEYFEVLYTGATQVDLQGLQIADAAATTTLGSQLLVDPGDRLVFARSVAAFTSCYGIAPDATFSQGLNNTGDLVRLSNAGGVIDEADFTTFTITAGVAWELTEPFETPERWCMADADIHATGDLGTPGLTNGSCPVLEPPPIVLITEVNHYKTNKPLNNYVELYNAGGSSADLSKFRFNTYTNGATTPTNPVVLSGTLDPGETFLLAYRSNPDWYMAGFTPAPDQASTSVLFNGDDVIALYYDNGGVWTLVDQHGVIGEQPAPGVSWNHLDTVVNRKCHMTSPTTTFSASDWIRQSSSILGTVGVFVPCPEGPWTRDVTMTWNEGGVDYPCPGTVYLETDTTTATVAGSVDCLASNGREVSVTIEAEYDPTLYGVGNPFVDGTYVWGGGLRRPNASGNPGPSELYGAFDPVPVGGLGLLSGSWAALPVPALADDRGTLLGVVEDGLGAPIPWATVTVSQGGVPFTTTTTDPLGAYHFEALPIGVYDVAVSASGFSAGSATGLLVQEQASTTRDFTLTP